MAVEISAKSPGNEVTVTASLMEGGGGFCAN